MNFDNCKDDPELYRATSQLDVGAALPDIGILSCDMSSPPQRPLLPHPSVPSAGSSSKVVTASIAKDDIPRQRSRVGVIKEGAEGSHTDNNHMAGAMSIVETLSRVTAMARNFAQDHILRQGQTERLQAHRSMPSPGLHANTVAPIGAAAPVQTPVRHGASMVEFTDTILDDGRYDLSL